MKKGKNNKATTVYRAVARRVFLAFVLPALLYLVIFYITQPHYLMGFSKGFYLDNGDGFQNVWNIWWVNKAITNLGQSPYNTTMLHWPHGINLVPQTMNIFNGLVAVPLIHVFHFSLIQATNFAVLFSFVFGGVTMFWFVRKLYGNYAVALVAGALFTFSSYHFAHAQGHLQLVSLEFIPLFLLAFWRFVENLHYRDAVYAALALFLVVLCDYYYLFWCVMLGALWVVWNVYKKKLVLNKRFFKTFGLFCAIAGALVGPLVRALLNLNKHDPLMGFHDPAQFSLDPIAVLLPGGSWYWHSLTDWYTDHLEYFAEMSIFFGYALLVTVMGIFINSKIRKTIKTPSDINFWWWVIVIFGVIAIGPRLSFYGKTFHAMPLPYALLEKVLPTLKISGMPVRWALICLLAAIVIASWGLSRLNLRSRKGRLVLIVFVAFSVIDLFPRQLPLTSPTYREYVNHLRDLPYGAVIDNGALSGAEQLYNQTLHQKPMAFGYVTRVPKSVDEKDFHIFAALEEGRLNELCNTYKIRYLTLPTSRKLNQTVFPAVYQNNDTVIYDLKNSDNC